MTLEQFFRQVPRAALAFSGGTDSAFLMWASRQYGCDLRAYYIKTAFQPAFELEDARRLAKELDVPMTVIELDVLAVEKAAENGPRRCYYCKKALFTQLRRAAANDGYTALLDGTYAETDEASFRTVNVLEGNGEADGIPFCSGDSFFLPRGERCVITGKAKLLVTDEGVRK